MKDEMFISILFFLERAGKKGYDYDWRVSEMWLVESVWSLIGQTAFITFLLEPENMEYVRAIMATEEKPTNRI